MDICFYLFNTYLYSFLKISQPNYTDLINNSKLLKNKYKYQITTSDNRQI